MSDETIRVNDLVAVVRTCCTEYQDGGSPVFIVSWVEFRRLGKCGFCGAILHSGMYADDVPGTDGVPLSWLRKIPPLSDLESTDTKERIEA